VAGEQGILSRQGQTSDRTLDRVGIDLDAAVIQEAAEAIPVVEAVAERPSSMRFIATLDHDSGDTGYD
jgi:hypothetical protein